MSDWIDKMSPEQARAWMKAPVQIEQIPFERDHRGRPKFRQANPLTMAQLGRIAAKAGL